MGKERFKRGKIHDVNMKIVILRIDYSGVADTGELCKLFDKNFPDAFRERNEYHNKEFNIQFRKEDVETIRNTLSLPVGVIEKESVMRYQGLKQGGICDVILDISKYYLCMTIKCNNNYDGLDNYIDKFKGAITLFKTKIPYFRPRRLGLRKVRVESKARIEEFQDIFEEHLFNRHIYGYKSPALLRKEFIDSFEITEFNYLRFNVRGLMYSGVTPDGDIQYTSSLDIDAYYNEASLIKSDINRLITDANLQEFEVYKYCMNESYLESIYQ